MKPDPKNPEGITQGEVLVHEYTEANQGAKTFNVPKTRSEQDKLFTPAHTEAIKAENDYRKEQGQKTFRLLPPKDVTRLPNANIVHFDDGHDERLEFKNNQLDKTTIIPKK